MASHREAVLQAVKALIIKALPNAEVKRNIETPMRGAPGGVVIIRDGSPGEPEVTLSPRAYTYNHAIAIELLGPTGAVDREGGLATMLTCIGDGVEADPTLGGLTEWLEPTAPDTDETGAAGAPGVLWSGFDLIAVYTLTSPLH